jgi:hypothetical protein
MTMFAEMVRQGVDNFVATQKMMLDLAAHQGEVMADAMKKNFGLAGWAPAMADLAGQGMQAFLSSQKMMLDLGLQQNRVALGALKTWAGSNAAAQSILEMLERGGQSYVEMQKQMLEMAGQQTELAMKAAKEGRPGAAALPMEQIAEFSKQGVQAWVESQKRILDMIQQQTHKLSDKTKEQTEAKSEAKPEAAAAPAPAGDFAAMARSSFEQYLEMNRKFMEMAGQQMAEMTKAFTGGVTYRPPVTLQDLARQGLDAWVNTQRAMLDLTFRVLAPR